MSGSERNCWQYPAAAGVRTQETSKGTSQRVPGMRVGEGAAFIRFSSKKNWYFLPLLRSEKTGSKTNEPRANNEGTTRKMKKYNKNWKGNVMSVNGKLIR